MLDWYWIYLFYENTRILGYLLPACPGSSCHCESACQVVWPTVSTTHVTIPPLLTSLPTIAATILLGVLSETDPIFFLALPVFFNDPDRHFYDRDLRMSPSFCIFNFEKNQSFSGKIINLYEISC